MPSCDAHEEMKEQLRDHERRIAKLEKTDAEFAVRLENLCKKLEELTSWMKALVIALISATGGFFIWYVQQLGR
ncbi:MAG: hemolysin XhlA family protein [Desulfotomaculum sp.]|nr:hemolysin XhlA family protein [Desulfotomaculum sp.]